MSQVASTLLYAAGIAAMFLLLIGPHELGHFLFAKLFRVRVIEFSIGAGTKLLSITRGGTLYALRAIPILGYVRMGGMEVGDFDQPNGFNSKAPLKRILILLGGPMANFTVAMIVIAGFGLSQLNDQAGKVVLVVDGKPAAVAGLRVGDVIKSVNGRVITSPGQIQAEEAAAPGAPLALAGVHSDGAAFATTITPILDKTTGRYQVGIAVDRIVTVQSAIGDGIAFPFQAVVGIYQGMAALATGKIKGGLLGPDGITGPIGIAKITQDAVTQGPPTYLSVLALLSVALGVTNLLPLLALDGGRIVVVLIEVFRRRPFDPESELKFHRWGLAALLAIAMLISFLDIQRIVTGTFPGIH